MILKRISLPLVVVGIAVLLLLCGGVVIVRNFLSSSDSDSGLTYRESETAEQENEEGAVTFQGKSRSELTVRDCSELGLSGSASREELEDWIKGNDGSVESWIAAVYLGKGDEEARWLERAVEAHPNEPAIAVIAAFAELGDSETVDWSGWIEHFQNLDPENAVGHLLSARKSANLEDWDSAFERMTAASLSEHSREYEDEHESALLRYFEGQGYRKAASAYVGLDALFKGRLELIETLESMVDHSANLPPAEAKKWESLIYDVIVDSLTRAESTILRAETVESAGRIYSKMIKLSGTPEEFEEPSELTEWRETEELASDLNLDEKFEQISDDDFLLFYHLAREQGFVAAIREMGWFDD